MSSIAGPNDPYAALDRAKKILDEAAELSKSLFEKGQAYNNALVIAGFGGLLALLASTKSFMPKFWLAAVALLAGISLLTFIAFVLYSMFAMSLVMLEGAKRQLSDLESFQQQTGQDTSTTKLAMRRLRLQMRLWLVSWFLSVASGFGAACIMLCFYGSGVLGL